MTLSKAAANRSFVATVVSGMLLVAALGCDPQQPENGPGKEGAQEPAKQKKPSLAELPGAIKRRAENLPQEIAASRLEQFGATIEKDDNNNVTHLTLTGKPLMLDDGMAPMLASFPEARLLDLRKSKITSAGLSHIKGAKKVVSLKLTGAGIGDAGMDHLAGMAVLRELALSHTKVTDEGIKKLAGLKKLEKVDLSNTPVGDGAAATLKQWPALVRINFYTTGVTDAGAAELAGLEQLTWLNLDNTKITDKALESIAPLENLTFLHLGRTAVSDAGLPSLYGLKNLKTIHVTRTSVTPEGVARLREALPDTEVIDKVE